MCHRLVSFQRVVVKKGIFRFECHMSTKGRCLTIQKREHLESPPPQCKWKITILNVGTQGQQRYQIHQVTSFTNHTIRCIFEQSKNTPSQVVEAIQMGRRYSAESNAANTRKVPRATITHHLNVERKATRFKVLESVATFGQMMEHDDTVVRF